MSILHRIEELQQTAIGNSVAKIKAALTLEDYSAKEINAAIKQMGVKGKAKSFASEYYDWLAVEPRTHDEAHEYIMGEGEYGETTENVKKHLSHYLNIWELTVRIWEK